MPRRPSPKPDRLTVREIAALCGVSQPVVSAVLSGKETGTVRFSEETRQRIEEVIRRTGFRPNRTARNFIGQRHGCIGFLGHQFSRIPSRVFQLLVEKLRGIDLLTMVEMVPHDGSMPRMLAEDCVDAIVTFEDLDPPLRECLDALQLPRAWVNTNRRDQPGCITFDEEGMLEEFLRRLQRGGRRHPALLEVIGSRGRSNHYSEAFRKDYLRRRCPELGLAPPLELSFAQSLDLIEDMELDILEALVANPQIDTIMAFQQIDMPHVFWPLASLGRRIPADVALVTLAFASQESADALRPRVAKFVLDADTLARRTFHLILDLLDGKTPVPPRMPWTYVGPDAL